MIGICPILPQSEKNILNTVQISSVTQFSGELKKENYIIKENKFKELM